MSTRPSPSSARLRLPAFGAELMRLRERGMVPVESITITSRWPAQRTERPLVVVPAGDDPGAFDYTFVAGLPVTIIANDRAQADLLARAVATFQPRILVAAVREPATIVAYIRDDGRRGEFQ